MTPNRRREPIRGIGVKAARVVREAIGYSHPTDLEIEVLAHMRGALVRRASVQGARANLIRVGSRGVIGVAEGLSFEAQRWAIAHELGHFEAHAGLSFLGLCTGADMVSAYEASGREPEANAFAAELLMPEDLVAKKCDVAKVSWEPVVALAQEFAVSATAAALRFVSLTDERVAVVCVKRGVVEWSAGTKEFGKRPRRGSRVDKWTEAFAFFDTGKAEAQPQTVSASAWVEGADDDEDLIEHVLPMERLGLAMSLLWRKC
jgi:Zn-dependent peptidase ImmA (M78 family)